MKLSRKSDYAIRALMTLVGHYGRGPVSVRELGKKNDIPRRFLEQIMLDLKSHGLVRSIPGRIGGFELAKPPDEITMGQVIRHFDGLIAPMGCVSASCYEMCSQEQTCRFRRVMLDIRNYTAQLMDSSSLAAVYGLEPVAKSEVFSGEYIEGGGI